MQTKMHFSPFIIVFCIFLIFKSNLAYLQSSKISQIPPNHQIYQKYRIPGHFYGFQATRRDSESPNEGALEPAESGSASMQKPGSRVKPVESSVKTPSETDKMPEGGSQEPDAPPNPNSDSKNPEEPKESPKEQEKPEVSEESPKKKEKSKKEEKSKGGEGESGQKESSEGGKAESPGVLIQTEALEYAEKIADYFFLRGISWTAIFILFCFLGPYIIPMMVLPLVLPILLITFSPIIYLNKMESFASLISSYLFPSE